MVVDHQHLPGGVHPVGERAQPVLAAGVEGHQQVGGGRKLLRPDQQVDSRQLRVRRRDDERITAERGDDGLAQRQQRLL